MRNMTQAMSGRAQRLRAAVILTATALLTAGIVTSFRQAPEVQTAQTYAASGTQQEQTDALETFRAERAGSRIAQLNALDELIDGGDTAVGAQAAQQKLLLVGYMEAETTLEGVLGAQGFEDVVCTVSGDVCNVLVRAQSLSDAQTAQILAAARDQTGLSAANVKVIPVG